MSRAREIANIIATSSLILPDGTTVERPASPATGAVRYNTTLELYEGYNGKEWAALSPTKTPDVYLIDNSLRFNDDDSAYLTRTPTVAGDRKTWTWSGWVKRGNLGTSYFFQQKQQAGASTTYPDSLLGFRNDEIRFLYQSSVTYLFDTDAVYRDSSAWYHIVLVFDTTQTTAEDRAKLYVNGVRQSVTWSGTFPLNFDGGINTTDVHSIGRSFYASGTNYFDGYLSEVNFIDGQALDPTSFGEFDDNGVWNPIAYAGTYGTNGFFLEFKTDSALGTDTSGNSNDWTPSGITTDDQVADTPTVNYATWNPLDKGTVQVLTDGNLRATSTSTNWQQTRATFAMPSGKWYWEADGITDATYIMIGITNQDATVEDYPGQNADGYGYYSTNGNLYNNGNTPYGATYGVGDTVGVSFDADVGELTFYKNGVSQGVAVTGLTNDLWFPAIGVHTTTGAEFNFGQRPFSYTPPTGFQALNSANLPDPVIADGKEHFQPALYTGNGTTQAIGGLEFQPDWVWLKSRSTAQNNYSIDAVRGINNILVQNNTEDEAYYDATWRGLYGNLTSFDSNGFTVVDGTDPTYDSFNGAGDTYVAWNWNAGGSTATNTDGTITSQVRANTTAGFSIVSYTGNGTAGATVGHGLGAAPEMIIIKQRNSVTGRNWPVYHKEIGVSNIVYLNLTNASLSSTAFNNTAPSSSVITLGSVNDSNGTSQSNTYIAYCFHSVYGFSKFGSYTGNGSTDGPFVYTGFRPAFVMLKSSSVGGSAGYDWIIHDTSRASYNASDKQLVANSNVEENKDSGGFVVNDRSIDILSNGFKLRAASAGRNQNGQTFIFMAFAENPFKTARAR